MELVTAAARHHVPTDGCSMLLLHRANILMQDTVEAARMCVRARIDPPSLAKHLLGAEHYQEFSSGESSTGGGGAPPVSEWSDVVLDVVGEAYASALGTVLKLLCESLMRATAQQAPAAASTAKSQPEAPKEEGSSSAGAASSSSEPSSAYDAEPLPVDRALLAASDLRQTCSAIELLRASFREGAPVHEWSISNFSQLGPQKLSSPPFELFGRRWSLLFHPRGCGANAQGSHLSAYLRLESGSSCNARVRLAVANHRAPALFAFNKPWQWRFETNGKNRGMSSLLPLNAANEDAGYIKDDTLVLQLWLRPLGAAESRCLPPGQDGGLPKNDMLQAASRRYFHCQLLLSVWCQSPEYVLALLTHLAPPSAICDPEWAAERHRLQLLALNAAAADGRNDCLAALLDAGCMYPVQLHLRGLPEAFSQYSGPYYRVEHPPERRYSFGRPVYRAGGCWLFFAEDSGAEDGRKARDGLTVPAAQWIVGREEDIGCTHGWMYSDDEATSPELIRGEWQLWQGPLEGAPHLESMGACNCDGGSWRQCERAHVGLGAPFLSQEGAALTPLHYAAWGAHLETTNAVIKVCKQYAPNPTPPRRDSSESHLEPECESPLLLAAQGTTGAAPVVQLLVAEGFSDYRALGQAATHTVRIGLLEAALLQHSEFMALVQDPFVQLSRAVQQFPKPLGAALSNLLGWFSCSLYRDGSTVGPFGSLSAQCQEAVLWRVAEAVLMPPGSTGNTTPLHLCALNESCLWEWLAQWDLMMRMSDKLESLLSEGLDPMDSTTASEGVYRNLALRYAAQLEECCQLLYGEQVTAELGIQSDGLSVERWSCGGQFLVDVIGRWVFGPSFWIKEHLWRLPDGPSRWEAYRGYHSQLHGTELLLPASYMSIDPWLLSLSCFRGSSANSGRESSMIRYCLELMQSHARHLEGFDNDEQSKTGKSRAEMSLSEAWKARCPYINALDLKRGKNRPLYSYMSSVITEGLSAEASAPPLLPSLAERTTYTEQDTAEFVQWMQSIPVAERKSTLSFPVQDLERLVWVSPIWEVLLNKLPEIVTTDCRSKRISCINGQVRLSKELVTDPPVAVRAMQEARASEHTWNAPSTPGDTLERDKQAMVEQLALCILHEQMVVEVKKESLTEDADRMAKLLIEEEEETKERLEKKKKAAKKKKKKKGKSKVGEEAEDEKDDDDDEPEVAAATTETEVPTPAAAAVPTPAAVPAPAIASAPASVSTAEEARAAPEVPGEMAAAPKADAKPKGEPQKAEPKLKPKGAKGESKAKPEPAKTHKSEPKQPKISVHELEDAERSLAAASLSDPPPRASAPSAPSAAPSAAPTAEGEGGAGGDWMPVSKRDAKGRSGGSVPANGTAPPPAVSSSSSLDSVAVDKKVVEALRDMTGAPTNRCEEALRLHNGNADSAALWLLLEGSEGGGAEPPARSATASSPPNGAAGNGDASSSLPAADPPVAAPMPPPNHALVSDRAGFNGSELIGVVRDTPPAKPYGFISMWHQSGRVTLFYHYNDVMSASKEAVKRHTAVAFQVASWSHGFKAERVRPLTHSEQRLGQKDTRMELLSAVVKKWSPKDLTGVLQLASQPCELPFSALPALRERLSVGSNVVCKLDGKGKDLCAVEVQLPPPAARALKAEELPKEAAANAAAPPPSVPKSATSRTKAQAPSATGPPSRPSEHEKENSLGEPAALNLPTAAEQALGTFKLFSDHVMQLQHARRPRRLEQLEQLYVRWAAAAGVSIGREAGVDDFEACAQFLIAIGMLHASPNGKIEWSRTASDGAEALPAAPLPESGAIGASSGGSGSSGVRAPAVPPGLQRVAAKTPPGLAPPGLAPPGLTPPGLPPGIPAAAIPAVGAAASATRSTSGTTAPIHMPPVKPVANGALADEARPAEQLSWPILPSELQDMLVSPGGVSPQIPRGTTPAVPRGAAGTNAARTNAGLATAGLPAAPTTAAPLWGAPPGVPGVPSVGSIFAPLGGGNGWSNVFTPQLAAPRVPLPPQPAPQPPGMNAPGMNAANAAGKPPVSLFPFASTAWGAGSGEGSWGAGPPLVPPPSEKKRGEQQGNYSLWGN